jgi:hypothetical protein
LLIYITPVCRSYYNSLIHDPTGEKDHWTKQIIMKGQQCHYCCSCFIIIL